MSLVMMFSLGCRPSPDTTAPSGDGESFDCATIRDDPVEVTVLDGPRAGRGLTFSAAGDLLVGVSEPSITQSAYSGPMELLQPGFGSMEQIDRLDDGDYVVANFDENSLYRITPEGGTAVISGDVSTYVVRVGPDGMVYTTSGESGLSSVVERIDPSSGAREVVVRAGDADPPFQARVLDFSPDASRMYMGTYTEGSIYVVELDDRLDPVGPPELLAESVGQWHDGLGVDACGYLWVASYGDQSTYRVSPDGSEVVAILQSEESEGMFGHGVYWGTGAGSFRHDALYLPQPLNNDTVGEALIGVPYRTWTGEVFNAP